MKKYLSIAALIVCVMLMTACRGDKDNEGSHNSANSSVPNESSEHSRSFGDDISDGLDDLSNGIDDIGSDIREGIDDMLPNDGDDSGAHQSRETDSGDSSR